MRFWVGLVAALVAVVLVVMLVLRNGDPVNVDLLAVIWPTKLWAAMVAAALVGAGLTALVLAWPLARLKLHTRRHGKRIAELEQEVHGLRTLPIATDPPLPSKVEKG
jgi:uncharacterized integral membrane protein